jgi:hypothetical protein
MKMKKSQLKEMISNISGKVLNKRIKDSKVLESISNSVTEKLLREETKTKKKPLNEQCLLDVEKFQEDYKKCRQKRIISETIKKRLK